MKTVFKNHSEVCHIWASRTQETGTAGNISFNNNVILSYHWWPMANFINDNTVLIVDHSYSNSTAKHINYVCRAIPDYYKRIYVNCPAERYGFAVPHQNNLNSFISDIKDYFDKFKTAVKYKSIHLRDQTDKINSLIEYCRLFNLPVPDCSEFDLNKEPYLSEVAKQESRLKEIELIKEQKLQILIANSQDELIKLENDWINGLTNKTSLYNKKPYLYLPFNQIKLRVKDDTIETSLGANVPLREAKLLYERIKAGKDIKGHKIGYYTVIGINGTLNIGCHKIERPEMERIATLLNW